MPFGVLSPPMSGGRDEATPTESVRQAVAEHTACERVLEAVASEEGVDPGALRPPLNDAVDADALEAVLNSAGPEATVRFHYRGHIIVVRGDSTVDVTGESRE